MAALLFSTETLHNESCSDRQYARSQYCQHGKHNPMLKTETGARDAERCGMHCAQVIRRIDVPAKDIKWSDSGELVAIIAEASFYVLQFSSAAVEEALASGAEFDEDGIDDAFELQTETSETVRTGPPAPQPPLYPFIPCSMSKLLLELSDSWIFPGRACACAVHVHLSCALYQDLFTKQVQRV